MAETQGDPEYIQMIKDALSARAQARQRSPHRVRRNVSRQSLVESVPDTSESAPMDQGSELARAMSSSPAKSMKTTTSKSGRSRRVSSSEPPATPSSKKVTIKDGPKQESQKTIDLSCQGLTSVQNSLFSMKDIVILDLSGNNLRLLPPDVGRLRSLVRLDLSRNGLRCLHAADYTGLPHEMAHLHKLQVLNISECNLPFLPPVIWKLTNLRELDVSRNKINMLVPEVGNLLQLRILNAQQSNLSTLPAEIAFCQNLEELLLWGNVIDSLPETLKELPKLHRLAINYRSFCAIVDGYMENLLRKGQIQSEHIPPVLFEMPCLDTLDLESTKINALPEACHARLQELYINNNYFIKAPAVIFKIKSLQTLDISNNLITSLPEEISNLSNLQILRANKNSYDTIPVTIGKLSLLRELAMGGNRLKHIPPQIGDLTSLKTLILDCNEIKTIPDTITKLECLETLDLTNNQITMLPVQFFDMKKLNSAHTYQKFHKYGLWLHKNPLTTPPPEVWKTDDPQNIYCYLRKLQIKQTENLQRQKLIVFGETSCGKTSLIKAMMTGKAAPELTEDDTTCLVDYTIWHTENDVTFLVIDMGGDPIYHSLQQMFMDPKALYLVVYDHRSYSVKTHEKCVGQWLEFIMQYAPNAVVKVVGTKSDLCYPDIVQSNKEIVEEQIMLQFKENEEKLKHQISRIDSICSRLSSFDNMWKLLKKQRMKLEALIKQPLRVEGQVATVSAGNGITGLLRLVHTIEMLAVNKNLFPTAQRYIPSYWKKFQRSLKLQKGPYLSIQDVVNLAYRHGLRNEAIQQCIEYLVDVGEIMWMPTLPKLQRIIFHNPRTLVDILRCLFRHNMEEFLDFKNNRIFVHKSQFTEVTFNEAVHEFTQNGLISRRLLHCLWFYLHLQQDEFDELTELVAKLDICYSVPQPDVPVKRDVFVPLLVLPAYNMELCPPDISDIWPVQAAPNEKEVFVDFVFPLHYPNGLFERFICRIQDIVFTRMDWNDFVFAESEEPDARFTISRCLHPETYDLMFKISVRSDTDKDIQSVLVSICQNLYNLIQHCSGLVWYVNYQAEKGVQVDMVEWFPQGLFDTNIQEAMKKHGSVSSA